jgi:hypothetical protein
MTNDVVPKKAILRHGTVTITSEDKARYEAENWTCQTTKTHEPNHSSIAVGATLGWSHSM